jgi:4-diphosphocytidyl-2-C-methyl-D-erythritol kinase
MTGVGETLLPLTLPKMPCVLVNPCVPVATIDVFKALGLRHGELLVGATDVILYDPTWPEAGASIDTWIAVLAGIGNDLEKPATRIQPVIGEVLTALRDTGARLARMSGSGATCFAIFNDDADAQRAAQAIQLDHPAWWVHAGALS